jgi:rhamnosyltransferase subunit B
MSAPVFIVTNGTLGDVLPFLTIAKEMQSRGHTVTVATSDFYQDRVAALGCQFLSVSTVQEHHAVLTDPMLWHPQRGFEVVLKHAQANLMSWLQKLDVQGCQLDQPTLVIAHQLALPFLDFLRSAGAKITVAAVCLAPSGMLSAHDRLTLGELKIPRWMPLLAHQWLWRLIDKTYISKHVLPALNDARVRCGLVPMRSFFDDGFACADITVALFPPSLGAPQIDWAKPYFQSGFLLEPSSQSVLPKPLQQFLDAGAAPLVFTPGSGHQHADRYFKVALQATRKLKHRAIFLTPHASQIPADLGADVYWQDFVPLQDLLPHAAVLIHHGGIGTTAEAMRSGVPQLIIPFAFDQFDNAFRVKKLGIGGTVSTRWLRAWWLARTIKQLSTASVRARCLQIAKEFADSGNVARFCHRLETFFESKI